MYPPFTVGRSEYIITVAKPILINSCQSESASSLFPNALKAYLEMPCLPLANCGLSLHAPCMHACRLYYWQRTHSYACMFTRASVNVSLCRQFVGLLPPQLHAQMILANRQGSLLGAEMPQVRMKDAVDTSTASGPGVPQRTVYYECLKVHTSWLFTHLLYCRRKKKPE